MYNFNLNDKFTQIFAVNESVYNGFLHIFKDTNPLHTNEQFAAEYGFSGRVMYGNILNGFLSYFIGVCLPVKNVIIHSQDIQFKNPVYLNDQLSFEATITGVYESVNAVEFKFNFRNPESKIVAKGNIQIGLL